MPGTFFGRRAHYLLGEHRAVVTDASVCAQLSHFATTHGLGSRVWFTPAFAAAHRLTLRHLHAPLNVWAAGYGESYRLLSSKMVALQLCGAVERDASADAAFASVTTGKLCTPRHLLLSAVASPRAGAGAVPTAATRAWVRCPEELEPFFTRAAAAAAAIAPSPYSAPAASLHSYRRELYWVSEALLHPQMETETETEEGVEGEGWEDGEKSIAGLHDQRAVEGTGSGAGGDGGGNNMRRPPVAISHEPWWGVPLSTRDLHTAPAVTTPLAYRTLVNVDQVMPSPRLRSLVAREYAAFAAQPDHH